MTGADIKAWRRRAGCTQARLAEAMNYSLRQIQDIESGVIVAAHFTELFNYWTLRFAIAYVRLDLVTEDALNTVLRFNDVFHQEVIAIRLPRRERRLAVADRMRRALADRERCA